MSAKVAYYTSQICKSQIHTGFGAQKGSVNPAKPFIRHHEDHNLLSLYKKEPRPQLWAFHKSRLETDHLLRAQVLKGLLSAQGASQRDRLIQLEVVFLMKPQLMMVSRSGVFA